MSELTWPERPTCHDSDFHAQRYQQREDANSWRPPRVDVDGDYKRQDTFRTCWYCGSIHPEDLYNHLLNWKSDVVVERPRLVDGKMEMGVEPLSPLGGSDWKYGWPHKFYVNGLPNLRAGESEIQYMYGGKESIAGRGMAGAEPEEYQRGFSSTIGQPEKGWRIAVSVSPSPKYAHVKWYNNHLMDLNDAAFDALAPLLLKYSGIEFTREGAEGTTRVLKYRAPYRGYQR